MKTVIIPNDAKGVLKNLAEIIAEHRNNNIQCLMLCYRRKNNQSTRTFFIGADDPHMFRTLIRLEHDILGLYSDECDTIEYFDD